MDKIELFYNFYNVDISDLKFIKMGLDDKYIGIPENYDKETIERIQAAILSRFLCLNSIDYTYKTYIKRNQNETVYIKNKNNIKLIYKILNVVRVNINNLNEVLVKINFTNKETFGSFLSEAAFRRLESSYEAVVLLILKGNYFEGHSILRIILEQLSWIYFVSDLKTIDKNLLPSNKTISKLKRLIPEIGKLYGFLSDKTHISHKYFSIFLKSEKKGNFIELKSTKYSIYVAYILLKILDIHGIVLEYSFKNYLTDFRHIKISDNIVSLKANRPLSKIMKEIKTRLHKL